MSTRLPKFLALTRQRSVMRQLSSLQNLLVIGLAGPIAALNVWLLSQVFRYFEGLITVLATAGLVAFLLNYPVRLFEQIRFSNRLRMSRSGAVTIVLAITVTLLVIAAVTLVPIVTQQTTQLLEKLPNSLNTSQQNLLALDTWAKQHNLPLDLQGFSGRINNEIERQLEPLVKQALGLALGTLNGLLNVILVLVLAFYMLLYGDRLWHGLVNLLPAKIGQPLSQSLRLNFHNFLISQVVLAAFMGMMLVPIFVWMNVPFALLLALLITIAELIPLIGPTLGIGLVSLILLLQNPVMALQVTIIATLLQQVRDNILAPKLMGDITGLNPIWIFVALLAGLQIAGFLGVVVAVPIAGTIKGVLEAMHPTLPPPSSLLENPEETVEPHSAF